MSEEIKPNPSQAPTHEAQLAAENMVSGEEKTPSVDVEADYKTAQQLGGGTDSTGKGEKADQKVTKK